MWLKWIQSSYIRRDYWLQKPWYALQMVLFPYVLPIHMRRNFRLSNTGNTVVATYEPLDPPELVTCEKVSHTGAQGKIDNPCTYTEIPDHLKDLYLRSSQNLSTKDKISFKQ